MKINNLQAEQLAKAMDELDDNVATVEFKQESNAARPSTLFIHHRNRTGEMVKLEKIRPDGDRFEKLKAEGEA